MANDTEGTRGVIPGMLPAEAYMGSSGSRRLLSDLGGPIGIRRIFGRLMPKSLVYGRTVSRRDFYSYMDPDYCANLSDQRVEEAWNAIYARANSFRRISGLHDLIVAVQGPAPSAATWCASAPLWIRETLERLDAINNPSILIRMNLAYLCQGAMMGTTHLILFLLFVERAWSSPFEFSVPELSALSDEEEGAAPVQEQAQKKLEPLPGWDAAMLHERADRLLTTLWADGPLVSDIRLGSVLAPYLLEGETSRQMLERIIHGTHHAHLDNQAAVVEMLATASALTAAEEIEAIGHASLPRGREKTQTRALQAYRMRYGLEPEDGHSYLAIATALNVHAPNIAQIMAKYSHVASAYTIWAPACLKSAQLVLQRLPALRAELDSDPVIRGRMGPNLSIEGLDRFIRTYFGANSEFRLAKAMARPNNLPGAIMRPRADDSFVSDDDSEVLAGREPTIVAEIHRLARKMVVRIGAAQLELVAARVTKDSSMLVTDEMVQSALLEVPDFEWLQQETGWFWFKDNVKRNRLVGRILRMLCVSQVAMPMEIFMAGLLRSDRHRGGSSSKASSIQSALLPPWTIIRELCRKLPYTVIDGHGRIAKSALCPAPGAVLQGMQLEIFKAMEMLGGVGRVSQIRSVTAFDHEHDDPAFRLHFADAAFIMHVTQGLYALRGRTISLARLGDAIRFKSPRKGRRRTTDDLDDADVGVQSLLSQEGLLEGE